MKRIIVCIAALVIMLFLFSVALPADISIICAEDVGFEKFYHIAPLSAAVDNCITEDLGDSRVSLTTSNPTGINLSEF